MMIVGAMGKDANKIADKLGGKLSEAAKSFPSEYANSAEELASMLSRCVRGIMDRMAYGSKVGYQVKVTADFQRVEITIDTFTIVD